MSKPILISGIQPSGRLHIGNYLGALKNFVDLQNSGQYECLYFIADYHSLTETFDPKEKQAQILNTMEDYLAAGLDPKKSFLFQQSAVPQVTELMWILNTLTPMGELRRMTQFKEKSGEQKLSDIFTEYKKDKEYTTEELEKIVISGQVARIIWEDSNAGLFTYPVLMAADILMYDAEKVPVGDDQLQHLEFARTLARKFNNRFGPTFIEPQPILTHTPRVMSLSDPKKKMSKTDPKGCLFLDDSPEEIREKLLRAVTDTSSDIKFDEKEKPGISNILQIVSGVTGQSIPDLEDKFKTVGYEEFKKNSAEMIADSLTSFREKKIEFMKKLDLVKEAFATGTKIALTRAEKKIETIKASVGLDKI
ncbi:MAG TPA: tryptophan--tRNA ligase [Candidatus Paceibacterota bacterium]